MITEDWCEVQKPKKTFKNWWIKHFTYKNKNSDEKGKYSAKPSDFINHDIVHVYKYDEEYTKTWLLKNTQKHIVNVRHLLMQVDSRYKQFIRIGRVTKATKDSIIENKVTLIEKMFFIPFTKDELLENVLSNNGRICISKHTRIYATIDNLEANFVNVKNDSYEIFGFHCDMNELFIYEPSSKQLITNIPYSFKFLKPIDDNLFLYKNDYFGKDILIPSMMYGLYSQWFTNEKRIVTIGTSQL